MTQAKLPIMLDSERAKYVNREIKYEEEIKSLSKRLADHIKREVMLREALYNIKTYADSIYDADNWCEEALAATDDLDGLILCHAEPAATGLFDYFGECHAVEHNPKAAMGPGQLGRSKAPLYRAWEPTSGAS